MQPANPHPTGPPPSKDDQAAAHEFLTELRTRIATRHLPYQYGIDEAALESLWKLFELARTIIKKYPGCDRFADRVVHSLNVDVRLFTSKWHQANEEGRLKSRDGADAFRGDLLDLQPKLRKLEADLHLMAYGRKIQAEPKPVVLDKESCDPLLQRLSFGITGTGTQLNEDESKEVHARRKHHGISKRKGTNAVGLALSGGGIRSAVFSLGVVQVLAQKKLIEDVDFLSTVSGGGYTGSFITSRIGTGAESSDLARPSGPDTDAIAHVRKNAKFLASRNLKESWAMVVSTVTGMILNWMVPLLVLVLAALAAALAAPHLSTQHWMWAAGGAASLTVLAAIIYNFTLSRFPRLFPAAWMMLASLAALTLLIAVAWLVLTGYDWLPEWRGPGWWLSGAVSGILVAAPAIIRFLPVLKSPRIRKLVLKLLLLAAGLIVPLGALACFYLLLHIGKLPGENPVAAGYAKDASVVFISYAKEDENAANRLSKQLEDAGVTTWMDIRTDDLAFGEPWKNTIDDRIGRDCIAFISLISRTTETATDRMFHYERSLAADRARKFPDGKGFYFPVVIDPLAKVTAHGFANEPQFVRRLQVAVCPEGQASDQFVRTMAKLRSGKTLGLQITEKASGLDGRIVLLIFAGALVFLVIPFLDINRTAPHRLYRDGLAKTFVRKTDREPDQPLADINPTGAAPYHLINSAVNLPSSTAPSLKDRRCDFFLFSKHWTGSTATSYLRTREWTSAGKPMDLATAMAVSGAAFSSYMGLGSIPSLTALLTFLNLRLGYWIKRPGRQRLLGPGFTCLLKEMTGIGMSEKSRWLNLSDGGHIENLAVYELLRRRCKFIICVDGEADPDFTFHGLMTLVRHARIDLGVRIEPDLDMIRPDPATGLSRSHHHLCRIHYPEANGTPTTGLLLYLKLSVTGNESELIKRYRIHHPEFPHQTTLDQFFDQEQFEAYRQLGAHVASGLFQPVITSGRTNPPSIDSWLRRLARNLLTP